MQRLILLLVLMIELPNTRGSTGNSYFDRRKRELENFQISFHPQFVGSNVDRRYYANYGTNVHNFKRLINEPELCSRHEKVFLLFAIRTTYEHIERRQLIREQLFYQQLNTDRKPMTVKTIFLFAKTKDPTTEQLIRKESNQYHDIIQEDFLDSYLNISLKDIMGWKWALEFCPHTEYVMIEDDELYVDINKMLSFLLKDLSMGRNEDHFAVCWANDNPSALQRNMKQFRDVPLDTLYKGDFYPPYCHGYGYAAHINVINQLYKATFTNPPYLPTDVWIGVMAEKMRIQIPALNSLYILVNVEAYFANAYYPVLESFVAVIDFMTNKEEGVKAMQHVHSSMKRHWARSELYRWTPSQWAPPQTTGETCERIILNCVLLSILTIIIIAFVCKIFANLYFRRR